MLLSAAVLDASEQTIPRPKKTWVGWAGPRDGQRQPQPTCFLFFAALCENAKLIVLVDLC